MKKITIAGLLIGAVLLPTVLNGCGDSGGGSRSGSNTGGGGGLPDLPTVAGKLRKLSSDAALETHLKQMLLDQYGRQVSPGDIVYTLEGDSAAPSTTPAPTVSTTNTQESAVDEADRIKTDGRSIYVAALNSPAINIFQANSDSAPLLQQYSLDWSAQSQVSGLYLPAGQQRLLALGGAGQGVYPMADVWFSPYYWQARETELMTLDVSDSTDPKPLRHLTVDGQLVSSRMIGSTLYLVTRHTPTLEGLVTYPQTAEDVANNKQLIAAATLAELLPRYQLDSQDQGALFNTGDCFSTDYAKARMQQTSIISVLAIDLDSSAKPSGRCFAGDAETLYVSPKALYLATTAYNYAQSEEGGALYNGQVTTDLHKFALAGNQIDYRGSGRVAGHLGWQQDLKSFRMSEHQDVLRIITFTGDQPGSNASPATLYTLRENPSTGRLEQLAQLPNAQRPQPLGKPGEQIYGVRFSGERGYLVTFRVTDPLYVLDLSNPADPLLSSELEINGYSDYLHPVGGNYLLGIGKDALPAEANDSGDGRGAWYQGVKLALIDISDPQAPFEKQQLIIGKRGTDTAVSQTHHALTTLQQGNTLRVALPVSRHDRPNSYQPLTADDPNPSYFYDWTQDELYRLDIDTVSGEWQVLPALVGSRAHSEDGGYSAYSRDDRSVMIDDTVYYLHGDKLLVKRW